MPYGNKLHLLNGELCHQTGVKQQTTVHSLLTTFNNYLGQTHFL